MIKLLDLINEGIKFPNMNGIKSIISNIRKLYFGSDLGNSELASILDGAFSKYNVTFEPGFGTPESSLMASAGLTSASTNSNLEIVIYYSDSLYEILMDGEYYNAFEKALPNLLRHEFIHVEQMRRLQKSVGKSKAHVILSKLKRHQSGNRVNYYLDKMEIHAFAVESVSEFLSIGYTKEQILHKLKHVSDSSIYPSVDESDSFRTYYLYFYEFAEDKLSRDTFKRFIKKMVEVL